MQVRAYPEFADPSGKNQPRGGQRFESRAESKKGPKAFVLNADLAGASAGGFAAFDDDVFNHAGTCTAKRSRRHVLGRFKTGHAGL